MGDYDHGPLQTYEIAWRTGHVERIDAHQVTFPGSLPAMLAARPQKNPHIQFHGEIDGKWMLILSALEDDIVRIRNVTQTEPSITEAH